VQLFDLVANGRWTDARTIYFRLLPIAQAISSSINFPAPVKEAVKLLGRPSGPPRLPTLPVDPKEAAAIREALKVARLL